jgi:hypothetical protein
MTKDEALRLALEALEAITRSNQSDHQAEIAEDAITAIKAALEAKDEPVTENGLYRLGYHNGYGFGEAYGKANAPQRKPLTDEDIALIDWESLVTRKDCVRAIEARLKQKNGNA